MKCTTTRNIPCGLTTGDWRLRIADCGFNSVPPSLRSSVPSSHRPSVPANYRRRGAVGAMVAVCMTMLLGMAALTIDVGHLYVVRADLQNAVDAAALAGVSALADTSGTMEERSEVAVERALDLAGRNLGPKISTSIDTVVEVAVGNWDADSTSFSPGLDPYNAVSVVVRARQKLFFAPILGKKSSLVSVSATAIGPRHSAGDLPMALRRPGFGPVAPTNPVKLGPSEPANGKYFEVGEKVLLAFNGKGYKNAVHLALDVVPATGYPYQLKNILEGTAELFDWDVPLMYIGDTFTVANAGDGGGHTNHLSKRLDYPDGHFLRDVMVAVVDLLPDSRDPFTGELTGEVQIVDVVSLHLDGIKGFTVPHPQGKGKMYIEAIAGTVTGVTDEFAPPGADLGVLGSANRQLVQ
ncbi:MAG: TadE/TadG family type IV pilus assembly protein [Phycisphaerae bacterium]